jgi:hypothetical protein
MRFRSLVTASDGTHDLFTEKGKKELETSPIYSKHLFADQSVLQGLQLRRIIHKLINKQTIYFIRKSFNNTKMIL